MGLTDRNILESDLPALENVSKTAIKEKQKFERLSLPKETLLEMFRVRSRDYRARGWLTHSLSTTNTRSISFSPKSPMASPPPFTDADLWSTCAWAPMCRTLDASKPFLSSKYVPPRLFQDCDLCTRHRAPHHIFLETKTMTHCSASMAFHSRIRNS